MSLEDAAVAKPDMHLAVLLSRVVSTGPGIGGIRLSRNVFDGQLIEDAYIYRMKRSAA